MKYQGFYHSLSGAEEVLQATGKLFNTLQITGIGKLLMGSAEQKAGELPQAAWSPESSPNSAPSALRTGSSSRLDLRFAASAPSVPVSLQSVPLLLSSQAQYVAPARRCRGPIVLQRRLPSGHLAPTPQQRGFKGLTVAPWRRGKQTEGQSGLM